MLTIMGSILNRRGRREGEGAIWPFNEHKDIHFDSGKKIHMISKKLPWLLFRLAYHLVLIVCFISIEEVGHLEKSNHLWPIYLIKREKKKGTSMCVHMDMWCHLPNKTFKVIGNGDEYMIHLYQFTSHNTTSSSKYESSHGFVLKIVDKSCEWIFGLDARFSGPRS